MVAPDPLPSNRQRLPERPPAVVRQALESPGTQLSPWALLELLEAYGVDVDAPGRSVSPEATSRLVGQAEGPVALVGRLDGSIRGPTCRSIASGRQAVRAHRAMRRVLTQDGTAIQGVAIRSEDPQARRIQLTLSRSPEEPTRLAVVPLGPGGGQGADPSPGEAVEELVRRLDELWTDVPELGELRLDPVALDAEGATVRGASATVLADAAGSDGSPG